MKVFAQGKAGGARGSSARADKRVVTRVELAALRRSMILEQARQQGLIGPQKDRRISGRVSDALLTAAKKRAALASDNDVIEYALARLAVEENYGDRLFRHEGTVPPDLDLEI